jgi:uncharacterized protein
MHNNQTQHSAGIYDESRRQTPTDLANFHSCRHRGALELSVRQGVRARPRWDNPILETLFELGLRHERRYVEALKQQGKTVLDLNGIDSPSVAVERTVAAMRDGVDIIVQAALAQGKWYGRPDVLLKRDRPSPGLGAWSYEASDTKLALETRAGALLQLGLYCDLIDQVQGAPPDFFHVVAPGPSAEERVTRSYRFHEYAAYFRLIKRKFEEAAGIGHRRLALDHQPDPVDHCGICPWFMACMDWWRETDHLCLVAGISRLQRSELPRCGVTTVAALAAARALQPKRGGRSSYQRIHDQARVQVRSRQEQRLVYELIPHPEIPGEEIGNSVEPVGLARLPRPSPGDLFLDLEGDALSPNGGREYLFGLVTEDGRYHSWWATNPKEERAAFEAVVDFISARLAEDSNLHVYHYAPYEPAAMKRLMGRYASKESEIDQMLRDRRFVDLYAVVRQSIRAGVERYSIKNMEPLYAFARKAELREAARALRLLEQALELERPDLAPPAVRDLVELYNRDDCLSTLRLRDWLEERRDELIASGVTMARPAQQSNPPSDALDEKAQRVEALRERLLAGQPQDPGDQKRTAEQQACYQLAYLLDWHRRESKSQWWEYYRLKELAEDDLLEERKAIAGLSFQGIAEQRKKSLVRRYRYPEQEIELGAGDQLLAQDGKTFATIDDHDAEARTVDLLVGPSRSEDWPTALFAHEHVRTEVLEEAIFAVGLRAAQAGGVDSLPCSAERALLLRETPRLTEGSFSPPPLKAGSEVTEYAAGIVARLDRTTLAIQGPPGAGKTYTGARMVLAAVRAGLKVGIAASGHKVIRNFIEAVARQAEVEGMSVRFGHKVDQKSSLQSGLDNLTLFKDNKKTDTALQTGAVQVLGGTPWLWSRGELEASVDILFVDEAGQVALANVLAVARATRSLVLLGDPQQLEQPAKGSHPDGVGSSALQYLLESHEVMPADRGLFLPVTWRMSPSIAGFTSELFYANQLTSKPGLERQTLLGGPFEGSGLWLVEVAHEGNTGASEEEAEQVVRIVASLLDGSVSWVCQEGRSHPMRPRDIRIVAPFNAHVNRIEAGLRQASLADVPAGTVDKFQGQEAPVAIYAMATSHPEDAPRGMEFLYSLNRLNVATSRARCAAIIIASPRLFEPDCQTPRQMKLANALCRFRELARCAGPKA